MDLLYFFPLILLTTFPQEELRRKTWVFSLRVLVEVLLIIILEV